MASGRTINFIAERVAGPVYGFDSFGGLPEDWRPGSPNGIFASDVLPAVRDNVELVVGLFDEVLPNFLTEHPATNIAGSRNYAVNPLIHHKR